MEKQFKKIIFVIALGMVSFCLMLSAVGAAAEIQNTETAAADAATVDIPEAMPSEEFVRLAWAAASKGEIDTIKKLLAQILTQLGDEAVELQSTLEGLPPRNKTEEYQVLNDVGTVYFIMAEAYKDYGRTDEMIATCEEVEGKFPSSQGFDPRMAIYWSVKEKCEKMRNPQGVPEEGPKIKVERTLPTIHTLGLEKIIDYTKYGEFTGVGTADFKFNVTDPKGLSKAAGEGVYPNTGSILKNPRYQVVRKEGRLNPSHWDLVNTPDLEASYFKWSRAPEPAGIRLFYTALVFEKAGMLYEAVKAYHALVIHFPTVVGWTYWQTPWYPAQAAVAKIKHIARTYPELSLEVKDLNIKVKNGFDNDINNDEILTWPGKITIRKKARKQRLKKVKLRKVKQRRGKGKVHLVQYENDHWQLKVNGKPFIIKGMTYAPTKIGQSPDKGTLVSWMYEDINKNGQADGPYDAWVDKNLNNEQDSDEANVGDFQLLKEMGVNTIREYHQPFKPNRELLRDMHEKYGFYVIMGDFLGKYALGSGAPWDPGTDYENPEHQQNMMESVKRMVLEHKDEPYMLLWLLGNENNYGVASNADKKPVAYYKFANEVAKMIKELDPDHPVAICNGDTLYLDIYAEHAPDIDIYSANTYRGDYGFGAFWEQVYEATGRPAFITEYGCPAHAHHLEREESEDAQANYHRGNWRDIEANLGGYADGMGNALGGVAFEWLDEWWKNYDPYVHDTRSEAVGPFPGGYYFEEWFGFAAQGNGSDSPFMRQLRKSYYAYQEMWKE